MTEMPPPAAQGAIRLTLQGNLLSTSVLTPAVRINGWPVPARYGENVLPVYAGTNRVEVSARWLRTYGEATLDVDVPAGQQVSVFYALPWHTFTDGAIGYEKQRRPGLAPLLVGASVIVAVALLVMLVLVLAG
jgi:hypothetical protein